MMYFKVTHVLAIFLISPIFATAATGQNVTRTKPENKFTSAEAAALQKIRSVVAESLYKDYMKEDNYLIRFLRAKHFNIEDAKEMLLSSLAWRKQNKIDNTTQETLTIEKIMPYTMSSDREDRPLAVLRIGQWKFRQMMLTFGPGDVYRGMYKFLELTMQRLRKTSGLTGKNITEARLLIDLTGFSTREHACVVCMPVYFALFGTYEKYYPRIFDKILFINTPRIFHPVWTVIKPTLTKFSRDSVTLYGFEKNEWKAELLKIIAENQLPRDLGGTWNARTNVSN